MFGKEEVCGDPDKALCWVWHTLSCRGLGVSAASRAEQPERCLVNLNQPVCWLKANTNNWMARLSVLKVLFLVQQSSKNVNGSVTSVL